MEMVEEVCVKCIDVNMFDVFFDDIDDGYIFYVEYKGKMEKWCEKFIFGCLIVK